MANIPPRYLRDEDDNKVQKCLVSIQNNTGECFHIPFSNTKRMGIHRLRCRHYWGNLPNPSKKSRLLERNARVC